MRTWLSLPFLPWDGLRQLSQAAESAGVVGVALSDHPCVPAEFSSRYPYGDKAPSLPVATQFPDPLVAIAGLAGATERVKFMTSILIAPLRHPVQLAKAVATVSTIAGDRLQLGMGVGWLREEFDALSNPNFAQRGHVMNEILDVLPKLWTGQPVSHDGRFFRFDEIAINPTPVTNIPLFLGGTSNAAIRRCARYADGWVGANHSVTELAEIVAKLRTARSQDGLAERPFEIRTGLRGAVSVERIRALEELNVDSLLLAPWQIGERRESVHDIPLAVITQELPKLVALIDNASETRR